MAKNSDAPENTKKSKGGNVDMNLDKEEKSILNKLKSLPPTNELLNYYQEALSKYEKQDEYLLQRLLSLSNILDKSDRLQMELTSRDRIISELQQKYYKTQEELVNLKSSYKENNVPSKSVGPNSDRRKMAKLSERDSSRSKPYSKSFDDKSQSEHLKEQICKQEQVHIEQLERERELRLRLEAETKMNLANHHCRLEEMEQTVCCLRAELEKITRTCTKEREEHRTQESSWLRERAKMSRKLCFYEKFGRPEQCESNTLYTNERVPSRVAEEKVLKTEINKLRGELQTKEQLVATLRSELGMMAQDNIMLKKDTEKLTECVNKIKDKTSETIHVLQQRNQKLEQRRRREAEGHDSDVQRLRASIKALEDKILALTASKEQEKENARILEDIRDELKKQEKEKNSAKGGKRPEWVD